MAEFKDALIEVLKYSDLSPEATAEKISDRFPSFSLMSKMGGSVVSESFGDKNAVYFEIIAALKARRTTDKFKPGKVYSEEALCKFLIALYSNIANETVHILTIDAQNRLISIDTVGEGTVNFSAVVPRKILEIMQLRRAKRAILAHNHPLGKADPSQSDIETTRTVRSLLLSVGKELVCHYVVAGDDVVRVKVDEV